MARLALHWNAEVVRAFREWQEIANTGTDEGRDALVAAVREARRRLDQDELDDEDVFLGRGKARAARAPASPIRLHELSPLKGAHVLAGQLEPLAVAAAISESLVPVRLDACGVVGRNLMNWRGALG